MRRDRRDAELPFKTIEWVTQGKKLLGRDLQKLVRGCGYICVASHLLSARASETRWSQSIGLILTQNIDM